MFREALAKGKSWVIDQRVPLIIILLSITASVWMSMRLNSEFEESVAAVEKIVAIADQNEKQLATRRSQLREQQEQESREWQKELDKDLRLYEAMQTRAVSNNRTLALVSSELLTYYGSGSKAQFELKRKFIDTLYGYRALLSDQADVAARVVKNYENLRKAYELGQWQQRKEDILRDLRVCEAQIRQIELAK